jgi:O-acetyl-ADP-ribose deacetylase (regulator of RNase III)
MSSSESTGGVRFGSTVIDAVVGELIDQHVQSIVYPANSRGVMGAGTASSIRFAGGPDIEREVMELAPFELGKAVITSSGWLQERGIESVIHAVIAPGLGDAARTSTVIRAIDSSLQLATQWKQSTVAMPLLGISSESTQEERAVVAASIVEAVVKYIRRPGTRIERLIIVCRFEDDLTMLNDTIARSRQRSWTSPAG